MESTWAYLKVCLWADWWVEKLEHSSESHLAWPLEYSWALQTPRKVWDLVIRFHRVHVMGFQVHTHPNRQSHHFQQFFSHKQHHHHKIDGEKVKGEIYISSYTRNIICS